MNKRDRVLSHEVPGIRGKINSRAEDGNRKYEEGGGSLCVCTCAHMAGGRGACNICKGHGADPLRSGDLNGRELQPRTGC